MFSIEEPAILEGIDPLRSEPEEVVGAATGSTGTKPIVEPDALADSCRMISIEEPAILEGIDPLRSEPEEVLGAATGSTGTKPIAEPDALAGSTAAAIIGANAYFGTRGRR